MTKKLDGLKVAPYYGCMLLRPAKEMEFDDPEQPDDLRGVPRVARVRRRRFSDEDRMLRRVPGRCATRRLAVACSQNVVVSALKRGADVIVTTCPLCRYNLDRQQKKMAERVQGFRKVPVVYFTQLLGHRARVSTRSHLDFTDNYVDPRPVLVERRGTAFRGGVMEERIGVFVCHCGTNIAGVVDVKRVAEELARLPRRGLLHRLHLHVLRPWPEPGQGRDQGAQADRRHRRRRARRRCTRRRSDGRGTAAGMNPYQVEIANIREQCSWVHQGDKEAATEKAIKIIKTMVEKAQLDEALEPIAVPMTHTGAGGGWRHRGDPGRARHRERGTRGHPGREGRPRSAATWRSCRRRSRRSTARSAS